MKNFIGYYSKLKKNYVPHFFSLNGLLTWQDGFVVVDKLSSDDVFSSFREFIRGAGNTIGFVSENGAEIVCCRSSKECWVSVKNTPFSKEEELKFFCSWVRNSKKRLKLR